MVLFAKRAGQPALKSRNEKVEVPWPPFYAAVGSGTELMVFGGKGAQGCRPKRRRNKAQANTYVCLCNISDVRTASRKSYLKRDCRAKTTPICRTSPVLYRREGGGFAKAILRVASHRMNYTLPLASSIREKKCS